MKKIFGLLLLMFVLGNIQLLNAQEHRWTGTWATAPEFTGQGDMPSCSLSNRSVRNIVQVSFAGKQIRVKLSNEFSAQPVEINTVLIADAIGESWQTNQRTSCRLSFSGSKNVVIPAGKALWSDPLKYNLKSGQRLAITVCYGNMTPQNATSHRGSRTTSYIIKGIASAKSDFGNAEKIDHWYNISAIDVMADGVPVVAVLGNSITDGRGTTTNKQNRWTDFMAQALNVDGCCGVLNLGIGGNCVVRGGISQPALQRFDRDILSQSGVTKLIIFEGTNDIGCSNGNSEQIAAELIEAYKTLAAKAKAKGLKVYGATITPFKGNGWYSLFHEAARQTVNEWIRKSEYFDGIVDFDALVRDSSDAEKLRPEFSSDWLHLNPSGYEAMGYYAAEIIKRK
jgi:lysophospholipase L1-like esterase